MAFFKKSKHIKIVPNQNFRENGQLYEKGKTYRVELGRARYWDRNGWLEGSEPGAPNPNLDIHDSTLGHWGGI